MPMTYQTSANNILSLKFLLVSSGVLSVAVMLTVTDFAVYVPSIYNGAISWLKPPYLYLVINCIIISIVASSKLQSTKDDASPPPMDAIAGFAAPQHVTKSIQTDYPTTATTEGYKYNGVMPNDYSGVEHVKVGRSLLSEFEESERADERRNSSMNDDLQFEDSMSNKENEYVVAKSTNNDYSPASNVKPPVSARFSHRRNLKASPEGGRTVLGVSKPKRQDTLESTWKTITEGRPIPISRHLRKSDTWERDSHAHDQQQEQTMKKAETFNDRSANTPGGSGGSGKLRKEPSLSQDDLNRRVEAFIKKFNEEMRLQRQESFNQYMEMINRGSH